MRRWARRLGVTIVVLLLVVVGAGVALDEPLPTGASGAEADARARRMMAAVDADAWARTGAVRFVFAGRNHHLWDRTRGFAKVAWGDTEVIFDVSTRRGHAWRDGARLADPTDALDHAHAAWVNDTFWLNPLPKAFDAGVAREAVGEDGLLLRFGAGGRTPGDAYLFTLDANGRPIRWAMWVSILPVGGLKATWAGWVRLPTGAWVSTEHAIGPLDLRITDLEAAETLGEWVDGPDPFAALVDNPP